MPRLRPIFFHPYSAFLAQRGEYIHRNRAMTRIGSALALEKGCMIEMLNKTENVQCFVHFRQLPSLLGWT